MTQQGSISFFLGANSPTGFRSYFDTVCPVSQNWNVYVIKGGPGTGKSTLMRQAAAEADLRGHSIEQIYCSSDPDSLDGIIISELKTAIFDGTAPHVWEPKFPGACENIVNTGEGWSRAKLRERREDIIRLSGQCSQHHAQAVRFLACAETFRENTLKVASDRLDRERIVSTAARLAEKYAGKRRTGGSESVRLLSAVTPKGVFTFTGTAEGLCSRTVPIIDRHYAASALLFAKLREQLITMGHDIITCRCSQSADRIEHILVPSADTTFTLCSDVHCSIGTTERAVHTERFMDNDVLRENKHRFSFNRRRAVDFTELAADEMKRAKSVHDRLEECYIGAMDFSIIDEMAKKLCREIFR